MRSDPSRNSRYDGFLVVFALVLIMWVSEAVDAVAGHRLDGYGIEARDPDGLSGIIAAPFLHGGFDHLISNTVPFLVMGFVIAFKGAARVAAVTAMVALVSGLGTWLVAPANT
ncbi:MAG TPA: rhomboid family intramembrane serine protease, partial [Thermoleophilaceae bacterium]|nr:rhomboid family intramembrane serine protease [Thermoleophilaceae bacterium]